MTLPEDQQKVEGVSQEEQLPRTARDMEIERIGEVSHSQRMKDIQESDNYFGTSQPGATEAAAHETPPAEEEPPVEPQAPGPKPADEEIELKVDGQIKRVPLSEIIEHGKRTLQKESAADKRLQEASTVLQQLQKEREQFQRLMQQAKVHGDEGQGREEAQEAQPTTFDPQTLIRVIDERAQSVVNAQIEARELRQWINQQYPEIASDPDLYQLAARKVDERHKSGDSRNDRDFYREILDGVKTKYVPPKGEVPKVATDTLASKEARKEAAPAIPQASGRKPAPQEEPEPTPEEIIREMRRARRQIVA